ncbi:MAG: hypothetical protein GQ570_11590 [Helicobacteraceae bacterium]|nr:hypothetical protein [Helicobacteraceae bacterium]
MTMKINIDDSYVNLFEDFIQSLPKDAVTVTSLLGDEIHKRVEEYNTNKSETINFNSGLDNIREK